MSSSLYDPDGDAVLDGLDYIKLLSQRDLSAAIPINFVTIPGVSLTAACFPFGRYDRAPAAKCFSNLLAVGFRRLDVDLYWDVSRTTWSFCPVELGDIQPRLSVSQDTSTSQRPSSTASLTAEGIPGAPAATQTPSEEDSNVQKLRPRQKVTAASASSDGSAVLSHSGQATLSAATLPTATTTETATLVESGSTVVVEGVDPEATGTASDQTLLSVGDYLCSPGLDLHLFLDVLYGHFANTEDNLNATMKYVVLNLHAAASASDPDGSGTTPSGSNLPQGNSLLSSLISANNSQYLFTPNLLLDQRADLNQANSWFTVSQSNAPDSQFYKVDRSNQLASTPDGWPSEGVVELMRARRMLAGFGTIDSQMAGYNFSGDASAIFPAGYLSDFRDLTFASNGSVSSGCIFRGDGGNDDDDPSVENSNSSWAVTDNFHSDTSIYPSSISLDTYLSQARNTIDCGITPILNSTLLNASADANPLPYRSFALSSIWSWAEDEPRTANITDPDVDADMANRCAVLNATSSRWQARDCGESHHAACRLNEEPYDFRISDASAAYAKAGDACRGSLSFAAARTSLENAYLLAAWRAYRGGSADQDAPDVDDELLWVDFNDLDVARCWVVGQNSTCPYQAQSVGEGRTVVVPTVAAVIVFVLALLTVFVKCAANRRNTRRRRKRGDDGWDYEGVPS